MGALKELEETAKLGDEAAWRSLLDRLPNANAIFHLNTEEWRTPLYVAAEEGRTSFVIELLRRGAEVNAPSRRVKRLDNTLGVRLSEA